MIRQAVVGRLFSIDRRYRQFAKLDTSRIPYAVNRTSSGNVPVYMKTRGIDRDTVTCVGSVYGDTASFIADLRMTVCADAPIKEEGRTVKISGRYAKPVKKWLQSLGF